MNNDGKINFSKAHRFLFIEEVSLLKIFNDGISFFKLSKVLEVMNGRLPLSLFIFALMVNLTPNVVQADNCTGPVFQVGWFSAHQGKSQHVNIEGLIGDDFSVKKSSDQNFLIGLGYYLSGFCIDQVNILYGMNAFYLAPTKVEGRVTQEDLFTNLSYHYTLTNYPIYFSTKALIHCCSQSDLTIDLGIGPNIISSGGFKERSLDGGITIPDRKIFSGKNVVTLSATVGLGWRISNLCEDYILEFNYRFFYLGQGELERKNDQLRNNLRTGHSYANALFVSISM